MFMRMLDHWEKKKEPFITIEVTSMEGYEAVSERLKKQIAKKPLGVDLHGLKSGNICKLVCPTCKNFLANPRKVNKEHNNFIPSYCPVCGQKIDWSDIK